MNAAAYAELNVVVLMAGAIELRQDRYLTSYRKRLPVPHPLALALYSNASMATEAAAALMPSVSAGNRSLSSHAVTLTREPLLTGWTRRPARNLKIRDRRDA